MEIKDSQMRNICSLGWVNNMNIVTSRVLQLHSFISHHQEQNKQVEILWISINCNTMKNPINDLNGDNLPASKSTNTILH